MYEIPCHVSTHMAEGTELGGLVEVELRQARNAAVRDTAFLALSLELWVPMVVAQHWEGCGLHVTVALAPTHPLTLH